MLMPPVRLPGNSSALIVQNSLTQRFTRQMMNYTTAKIRLSFYIYYLSQKVILMSKTQNYLLSGSYTKPMSTN